MEAIILAGGFGTRLRSVVSDVPKPMASVAGVPFLTHILDELDYQGFTHVVFAVSYLKEVIIDYFKDQYKNIKIEYSIEDEPLGTGGCVKQALSMIHGDYTFVLNGDTMFKINYKEMAKLNNLSIAVKRMYKFDRYGRIIFDDNNIIRQFLEKEYSDDGYINCGTYYLPKNIFDNYELNNKFSLEKDFFEKYIDELNIKAFISDGYFIDIGIPEDYNKAQLDFKKKKAVFLDRDGIINIDYGHVHKIEDFKFTPYIFDILKKYKDDYLFIVITNQAGIAKGLYKKEDFYKLNEYMINEFKKKDIEINAVYYCPHKDEDNCNCRKPKPGLFLNAIHDFNIDVDSSIAIGDKLSDLEAAHSAGIKKLYFVHTNYDEYKVSFQYEKLDV